jgi:hypothetical protein
MAKTAKRLFGPAQVSNAAATKYTAPAATTTVLRHVHVSNPTGSPVTFTMSIGADAAGTRLFDAFTIPAATTYDWYGYAVIAAAEVVQAFAGTNNVITLTGFGDELSAG